MPGRKTKLGCPEVAAVIDDLHAKEPDGWRKNRLLAVKLAAKGEYTSDEIADLCAVSRTHIYKWFKIAREIGLDALLEREKPGPREGSCRGITPELLEELRKKLESNEFMTIVQAQRWLEQKNGIKRPYNTVWVWLKKFGGVLLVPRPSHSKKDPAASEAFRNELGQRLEALQISAGSKVKIWVMDEMARISRGRVIQPSQIAELIKEINALPEPRPIETRIPLWSHWGTLVVT